MQKFRILIVDDDKKILDEIKSKVNTHDIYLESNPLKALEQVKQEKYDIYIIDYVMSGINGTGLLRAIKEANKDNTYIAILMTGWGTTHLFNDELRENLFKYFLEKPFYFGDPEKTINKAVTECEKGQGK